MEQITNRIGNGWLTHNYYSHWRSIFLEGWNWSVHHPQQYRLDEYVSSSSTLWHYQEEGKGQLISSLIFLCAESKIHVVFINTVFPIWIWWIIKRDSKIYIIFGAFKSTIYREESYTSLWDSYLTLMAPGSCTSTHARFRFYSLNCVYSC